jgi:Domain of unknown function (DUF4350)
MKSKMAQRRWWFGGILLATLVLLTLLIAPSGKNTDGSTFGKSPDGYGAWYDWMAQQGVVIERWQKPAKDFFSATPQLSPQPVTFLQIYQDLSNATAYSLAAENWVKQGNTLVLLGVRVPVTPAVFSSRKDSPQGAVKIETSRRWSGAQANEAVAVLLGDRFGGVVWQRSLGKGKVIAAATPYLAANAYQDEPGNFAFLAQLVKQAGGSIKVDEYLHGYKDAQAIAREVAGSWVDYLAKTPLLPIGVQSLILLIGLIWAKNRRLGPPLALTSPTIDNSEAYIQALAGVLQKAGSSEFILETVGKAEQLQLQRKLGLGAVPLTPEELINAWVATGRSAADLQPALRTQTRKRRLSDAELATWLQTLQTIRQQMSGK